MSSADLTCDAWTLSVTLGISKWFTAFAAGVLFGFGGGFFVKKSMIPLLLEDPVQLTFARYAAKRRVQCEVDHTLADFSRITTQRSSTPRQPSALWTFPGSSAPPL
jgi:hypothetical protein